jgi:hypothetical protein
MVVQDVKVGRSVKPPRYFATGEPPQKALFLEVGSWFSL